MPRIGLPAKPARAKSTGSGSASPMQMLRVALGATAFRVLSALVAAFCAVVFARTPPDAAAAPFGLYPILTHQVDRVAGRWLASSAMAALVVSWIAFAGAMVMLLRVAQLDVDADQADGAVLLAVVFPFAFVFGRAEAGGLFLLFALGAFRGFRQQKWIVGGLCGALATASMPSGILIVPALAWIGFREPGAKRTWVAAGLLLTAAGFCAYLSYMYYLGGPPGGWADAMHGWGFHLGHAPWRLLRQAFTSHRAATDVISAAITVIALATVPLVWWKLDGGYAIYMLAMLWLPLTSGDYPDLGRACALLFPMFVLAAGIRWRVVFVGLAVASTMFYALNLAQGL